jgi:F-type H+-transporting ATPase subunit b
VSRRATALFASLGLLLLPRAALAAGDGVGDLLWETANLALLFGVLFHFARRPVLNYLAERRDSVRNDLETAEKLLKDAHERLAEWSRRAAQLDEEVASIRGATRESAEHEAASIVAQAEETAARIRAGARVAMESEVRRARRALRAEAGQLAVTLAAEILRQRIADEDRDRLVDEFVARVAQGGER